MKTRLFTIHYEWKCNPLGIKEQCFLVPRNAYDGTTIFVNKNSECWKIENDEKTSFLHTSESSTSSPGGNQVDSLPPLSSFSVEDVYVFFVRKMKVSNVFDYSFSIMICFPSTNTTPILHFQRDVMWQNRKVEQVQEMDTENDQK